MAVPYTFGTATSSIPLSQLDSNFNTVITLGNTAIQLGNTVTTLNNMTLANVTISSGNVTITNVSITTANVTTANITTAVIGTETVTTSTITTANVTTANITTANITNGTVITSLTLSYGTANGVAYLNGSKVLTTGSAFVFDGTNVGIGISSPTSKLHVVGGRTDLTAGSETYALGVRYNTSGGIYYIGATNSATPDLVFSQTGGSERMRLTNAGDLGIGTSSPAYKLDVNGNAQIGNATAATNRVLIINGVVSKASRIAFQESGTDRWLIGNGAASENGNFEIYDATNGNNLVMTRAGNLGLGVTPSAWGGIFKAIQGAYGGCIAFQTSGPSTKVGNNWYYDGTNYVYTTTNAASRYDLGGGSHAWYNAPSGTAGNAITFTQAMTLTADGNLLVGTTTNTYASRLVLDGGASSNTLECVHTGTANTYCAIFSNANGAVGSIRTNGSATLYDVTSDYRLKTVIGVVADSGQRIDALQPVEYTWNADGSRTRGFLAHQFQEVYASSVSGTKDAVDADGNPVYQAMQAGTSEVIADLVAEIQSLRKRLADAGIA